MEKIAHGMLFFVFIMVLFQWIFNIPSEEVVGEIGAYLIIAAIILYVSKLIYLLITRLEVKD